MSELVYGQKGTEVPSQELLQLVQRNGIECPHGITARDLNDLLQKQWLRTTVRAEIEKALPHNEDIHLLRALGMVDEVQPARANYTGTLVLGGYAAAMRRRLAFAIGEWNANDSLETGTIWFLTGKRPRRTDNESDNVLLTQNGIPFKPDWMKPQTMPATETEIARMIWDQSAIPSGMMADFVDTPLQPDGKGGWKNPNTADTFTAFLAMQPDLGNYLLASSQPYVQRQTLNATNTLPPQFNVFEMGPAALPETPLKIFLDEAARLLFELIK